MNENIRKAALGSMLVFVFLFMYLTWLQVYRGDALATHPRNKRLLQLEETVPRGTITDARGIILAQTRPSAGKLNRVYPQGEAAAHLIGYTSAQFGKTGLERAYNKDLLGLAGEEGLGIYLKNRLFGIRAGNNLILTIDMELQNLAYRLLGGRKGALVAMKPATGEILALVSSPAYDPNKLDDLWPGLVEDTRSSPLLNRATQGLYPPGSTIKVITGAAALGKNPGVARQTFSSPGYLEVEGYRLEDTVSGTFTFEEALQFSSNAVFGRLGLETGASQLRETAGNFLFGQELPFDLPVQPSRFPDPRSPGELAESAIGQGRVLATPLEMALTAAAIANDGVLMKPYLVKEIRDPGGELLRETSPKILSRATSPEIARLLTKAMVAVVRGGTGQRASLPGVQVAGKTGSAENPHGPAHSWFIGFAPAEKPQVAVAVIVENGGPGGAVAAPLARAFLAKALP